jgi:hypothetical protein
MKRCKCGKKKIVAVVMIGFVVVVVTIACFLRYNKRTFQEKIARIVIANTLDGMEHKINGDFERVPSVLEASTAWFAQAGYGIGEISALNAHFMPVLKRMRSVSGIIAADNAAHEYFLCSDAETWISSSIDRARFKDRVIFQRWNERGELISEWQEESKYVPTDRPWFAGALQKIDTREVFWTGAYTFSAKKKLGISASQAISYGKDKGSFIIIAIDILLDDARALIAKTSLSRRSLTALATSDGEFISSSRGEHRVYEDELAPPKKFMNGEEGILLNIALGRLRSAGAEVKEDSFDLSMKGERWWVAFRKLSVVDDNLVLLIALPEDEVFEAARSNKMLRVFTFTAAVGLIILFATIIVILRRTKSDEESRIG